MEISLGDVGCKFPIGIFPLELFHYNFPLGEFSLWNSSPGFVPLGFPCGFFPLGVSLWNSPIVIFPEFHRWSVPNGRLLLPLDFSLRTFFLWRSSNKFPPFELSKCPIGRFPLYFSHWTSSIVVLPLDVSHWISHLFFSASFSISQSTILEFSHWNCPDGILSCQPSH